MTAAASRTFFFYFYVFAPGLDVLKHNEPAYPASAWLEESVHTHSAKNAALGAARLALGAGLNGSQLFLCQMSSFT
jgi:hypothetical protein